jgi:hypothetical protein
MTEQDVDRPGSGLCEGKTSVAYSGNPFVDMVQPAQD